MVIKTTQYNVNSLTLENQGHRFDKKLLERHEPNTCNVVRCFLWYQSSFLENIPLNRQNKNICRKLISDSWAYLCSVSSRNYWEKFCPHIFLCLLKLWSKIQKKHFYTPSLKIRSICTFTNRDFTLLHTNYKFLDMTEADSKTWQTCKRELFAEIINAWRLPWYEVEGYFSHPTFSKLTIVL